MRWRRWTAGQLCVSSAARLCQSRLTLHGDRLAQVVLAALTAQQHRCGQVIVRGGKGGCAGTHLAVAVANRIPTRVRCFNHRSWDGVCSLLRRRRRWWGRRRLVSVPNSVFVQQEVVQFLQGMLLLSNGSPHRRNQLESNSLLHSRGHKGCTSTQSLLLSLVMHSLINFWSIYNLSLEYSTLY